MNKPSPVQSSSIDTLLQVAPEQIVPNPQQPRKHFDEKSLNELAQSISAQGVLQPLVVRKHPEFANQYELCLLYTSPSPRDRSVSRMPSSA